MSIVKVNDIAYVRYRTTDLDLMQQFLLDFGMQVQQRTDTALYMRGTEPSHYIYVTELATTAGFVGPAFGVDEEKDLSLISARVDGASAVEANPGPGGGKRVRVLDPDGYQFEFVHGIQSIAEIKTRPALILNTIESRQRRGSFQRPDVGPAHVRRIGHTILRVTDYAKSLAFYQQFGFLVSDETHEPGQPDQSIVGFLKCDRGQTYTDHHTLGLAMRSPITVDHTAYECIDLDDVVQGGRHLEACGYKRAWGVGRHILGSQIFDYWRDPFGFKVEHWTDGDLVNVNTPSSRVPAGDDGPGAISQWNAMTEDYLKAYPQTLSIGPEPHSD